MRKVSVSLPIEYRTRDSVPLPEVIASLSSLQIAIEETGKNAEEIIVGLRVQSSSAYIQEISHGSLKEKLVIVFLVAFQEDLVEGTSAIVQSIFGGEIPREFDEVITLLLLTIIIFGASAVKDILTGKIQDTLLCRKYKELKRELALKTGQSEEQIESILQERYKRKGRINRLMDAAIGFFRPSKSQSDAPIRIGEKEIESEIVKDVPSESIQRRDLETKKIYENIKLEIHAQDRDRDKSGWAAIPIGISEKRLPMKLAQGIDPNILWGNDSIYGNIQLVSKRLDDRLEPSEIYLLEIRS